MTSDSLTLPIAAISRMAMQYCWVGFLTPVCKCLVDCPWYFTLVNSTRSSFFICVHDCVRTVRSKALLFHLQIFCQKLLSCKRTTETVRLLIRNCSGRYSRQTHRLQRTRVGECMDLTATLWDGNCILQTKLSSLICSFEDLRGRN